MAKLIITISEDKIQHELTLYGKTLSRGRVNKGKYWEGDALDLDDQFKEFNSGTAFASFEDELELLYHLENTNDIYEMETIIAELSQYERED